MELEIRKIDDGHYQVRASNGDIISNHSTLWGARQMVEGMKKAQAQPYQAPALTPYGDLPTTTPA